MVIIHSDQIAQQDGVYLAIGVLDKEDEGEPKGPDLDKSQGCREKFDTVSGRNFYISNRKNHFEIHLNDELEMSSVVRIRKNLVLAFGVFEAKCRIPKHRVI